MFRCSRKPGESVVLRVGGQEIIVHVVGGRRTDIGITAPRDVVILRGELAAEIARNGAIRPDFAK